MTQAFLLFLKATQACMASANSYFTTSLMVTTDLSHMRLVPWNRLRFSKARLRRKVFPLSLGSLNLYVSLPTQVHSANWPQTPVLFMNDLPTVVSWNVKPELRMTLCSTPILSLQLTMLPFNRTCCVRARVTILARHRRWRNWLCLIVGLCKSDQATLKMQWIPNSPRSTVSPGKKKIHPFQTVKELCDPKPRTH